MNFVWVCVLVLVFIKHENSNEWYLFVYNVDIFAVARLNSMQSTEPYAISHENNIKMWFFCFVLLLLDRVWVCVCCVCCKCDYIQQIQKLLLLHRCAGIVFISDFGLNLRKYVWIYLKYVGNLRCVPVNGSSGEKITDADRHIERYCGYSGLLLLPGIT